MCREKHSADLKNERHRKKVRSLSSSSSSISSPLQSQIYQRQPYYKNVTQAQPIPTPHRPNDSTSPTPIPMRSALPRRQPFHSRCHHEPHRCHAGSLVRCMLIIELRHKQGHASLSNRRPKDEQGTSEALHGGRRFSGSVAAGCNHVNEKCLASSASPLSTAGQVRQLRSSRA